MESPTPVSPKFRPTSELLTPEALELLRRLKYYYIDEINRLTAQAKHWRDHHKEKPLAVHHRVNAAIERYQTLVLIDHLLDTENQGWSKTECAKLDNVVPSDLNMAHDDHDLALYRDAIYAVNRYNYVMLPEDRKRPLRTRGDALPAFIIRAIPSCAFWEYDQLGCYYEFKFWRSLRVSLTAVWSVQK